MELSESTCQCVPIKVSKVSYIPEGHNLNISSLKVMVEKLMAK